MAPRDLIARVQGLDARGRDLLAGVVIGAEMQLEALFVPQDRLIVHALMLLLAGALALRRRFPIATYLLALVPFVAVQALGEPVTDHLFLALFVCIFMSYSVAANS